MLPSAADIRKPAQIPPPLFLVFVIIWIGMFLLLSVYDGRKNLRLTKEFGSLTLGTVLAAVSLAGTLYFSYRDVSRLQFLLFIGLTYLSMLSWRVLARTAFRLGNGRLPKTGARFDHRGWTSWPGYTIENRPASLSRIERDRVFGR